MESVPGYARGLAFAGQFAFVGLSKIRETNIFGACRSHSPGEMRCGIAVVDLISGKTVSVFQFHSGVEEIYAVDVIPSIAAKIRLSRVQHKETQEHEVWI